MSAIAKTAAAAPLERGGSLIAFPPPRKTRSGWVVAAIVLAILAGAAWLLRPRQKTQPATATLRTVRAVRGMLQRTVRVSGSISASQFQTIFAPTLQGPDSGRGLVLISLGANGGMVKRGAVVAQIDAQNLTDHIDDVEAMVGQSAMDLKSLKARQAATRQNVEQRVLLAKARLDKAVESARALEVRNTIQQEQLKLELEEARENLDETQKQLDYLAERQTAEWDLSEMNQQAQIRHLNRHKHDLEVMTIRAPIDGQVVLQSMRRGSEMAQVRLGDELSPAQPFMKIVDLSKMQVSGTMNQADAELLKLGQKAKVRFDAYPQLVLDGHVDSVGALAVSGRRMSYWVHTIQVRIALDGKDPLVIPDLTASADVVIGEQDGLLIPREAVQDNGGKSVVYVKQGEAVAAREVGIGDYGRTQVSVTSGLEAGDEIVIR